MFNIRIENENKQIDATNKNGVVAKPMHANAIEKKRNDTIRGMRLSNFDTNQPEIGNPNNELMGIAKRIVPSSASFKLKNSLMVGIRDAQVAKQMPERKKYMLNAIRCFCFNSIGGRLFKLLKRSHTFLNAKIAHCFVFSLKNHTKLHNH